MRKLTLKEHYTKEDLLCILKAQTEVREYQEWQIIYSVACNTGKTADDIADILCVKKRKIYNIVQQYNKYGREWREKKQWGGRRDGRSFLTLEEEKLFMKEMEIMASEGKILTYHDIKKEIEKKLQHLVSGDYIWELFKRHKWKKKSPRQKHPKSDVQAQEEFKKNLSQGWTPIH